MEAGNNKNMPDYKSLTGRKVSPVQVDQSHVRTGLIIENGTSIRIVEAMSNYISLDEWLRSNLEFVKKALLEQGGILFRGFGIQDAESFYKTFSIISPNTMDYKERTSPRTEVIDKVYTSTNYSKDEIINMHNEMSYSGKWPMKIAFACLVPAENGGETPVADVRNIFRLISSETIERFRDKGVKYVRNISKNIGLSWQEIYQTNDRKTVEAYCASQGIAFKWKGEDGLSLEWIRPAVQKHPVTGEDLWFNHAYFYNAAVSLNLDMTDIFEDDELPFNTFYGDGTPIGAEVLAGIGEAYSRCKAQFSWMKGDLLLLDNMLLSHGRNAYNGDRKIIVAMGND